MTVYSTDWPCNPKKSQFSKRLMFHYDLMCLFSFLGQAEVHQSEVQSGKWRCRVYTSQGNVMPLMVCSEPLSSLAPQWK